MKVVVLGLGYVGSTMAACLTRSGHAVVGIDKTAAKLAAVAQGRSPVREPEVAELMSAALGRGLLTTAADIGDHPGLGQSWPTPTVRRIAAARATDLCVASAPAWCDDLRTEVRQQHGP